MISQKQGRFYWGLWSKAKAVLMADRETWSTEEENRRRHELHVRALGRDKSHLDFSNHEFDLVIATFRAIIDPANLDAQLAPAVHQKRRMMFGLEKLMRELNVGFPYASAIVHTMNMNGELSSNRLDALGVDDLRKVMIALRKHKQRGGGTVSAPRGSGKSVEYILNPA